MEQAQDVRAKRRKLLPEMEGTVARWYARNRGSRSQLALWRAQAGELTDGLPAGADILEVAPGPGYFAIELARLGRFRVTGLDIGRTFVGLAGEQARRAGVEVDFRHGDVQEMPFDADSFDLVVCQAAFKNFTRPVTALDEMHRVLRPGGTAVIQDLSREASDDDIRGEIERMEIHGANAWFTRRTLTMLRRRASSRDRFERLAAASAFGGCAVQADGITIEVRLSKPATV